MSINRPDPNGEARMAEVVLARERERFDREVNHIRMDAVQQADRIRSEAERGAERVRVAQQELADRMQMLHVVEADRIRIAAEAARIEVDQERQQQHRAQAQRAEEMRARILELKDQAARMVEKVALLERGRLPAVANSMANQNAIIQADADNQLRDDRQSPLRTVFS